LVLQITILDLYIANALQYAKYSFKKLGKPCVAVLLIGLVSLLNLMAVAPALHQAIHHDAGRADHDCAVTMFAHGNVELATCDIPVVMPTIGITTTPLLELSVFSTAIENLPFGRAPPAVFSPPL
jgi:hypothetical protein